MQDISFDQIKQETLNLLPTGIRNRVVASQQSVKISDVGKRIGKTEVSEGAK